MILSALSPIKAVTKIELHLPKERTFLCIFWNDGQLCIPSQCSPRYLHSARYQGHIATWRLGLKHFKCCKLWKLFTSYKICIQGCPSLVKQIKDKYEFRKRTDFLANNTMRTTDTTIQQRYKLVNSNFSERANHETLMRKQGRNGNLITF